ncbi:MAG: aminotransferase class I/II-fold pyridoxal phosphate-dependent enzyme [Phycisphaerales bacterium]|nr:MAG: aminotransferase class I/II-fold pyridoxal phosphate-dependent enzyme [Phycisphaerales bacterium]
MTTTTKSRVITPAHRTRDIKYAVRDIVVLAEEAKKAGKDMMYLNIGDPNIFDFITPDHIVEAAHEAMRTNRNSYSPSSGIPEAIDAVNREAERKGIKSICHTYITSGCSEGIELALTALVNPGENVLTPSPGYPLYTAVIAKLEAENRPYYLDEGNAWQPDIEDIASKIDGKTRAIVLINPNNPTGSVCSAETLQAIIDLAIEHNLVVISDEIYDKLTFDGRPASTSTASLSAGAKVITFNGLSKSYLVPGFRVGWGVISGPPDELEEYCEGIRKMERARVCANHPLQYAIKPALEGTQEHLPDMIERLQCRRDITVDRLNAIDGISCVKCAGAFYAFPKIELGIPDTEFVTRLIRETGVVVVPGSGFGQRPGTNHFRVVFLPPEETLVKAFNAIASIAKDYR